MQFVQFLISYGVSLRVNGYMYTSHRLEKHQYRRPCYNTVVVPMHYLTNGNVCFCPLLIERGNFPGETIGNVSPSICPKCSI